MTRNFLSGIAAAALFSLLASAPAGAGGSGWGCRTCGYSNGTQLTGLVIMDSVTAVPASQRPAIMSNDRSDDRAGRPTAVAQLKAKRGGQGSATVGAAGLAGTATVRSSPVLAAVQRPSRSRPAP
jgi:hypothetical protein